MGKDLFYATGKTPESAWHAFKEGATPVCNISRRLDAYYLSECYTRDDLKDKMREAIDNEDDDALIVLATVFTKLNDDNYIVFAYD